MPPFVILLFSASTIPFSNMSSILEWMPEKSLARPIGSSSGRSSVIPFSPLAKSDAFSKARMLSVPLILA